MSCDQEDEGSSISKKKGADDNVPKPELKEYHYLIYSIAIIGASIAVLTLPHIFISKEDIQFPIILDLFDEVGKALFILGSISILLEINDFSGFFVRKLRSIVLMDECVKRIDPSEKERLLKTINKSLYYNDKTYIVKDFFDYYHTYVSNMKNGYFYDKYDIMIECKIDEDGRIIKRISRTIEMTNSENNSQVITFPLISVYMKNCALKDGENLFCIKNLIIDNKKIVVEQKDLSKCSFKNDVEDYNICIKYKNHYTLKNRAIARLDTETIVPLTDSEFSHLLDRPCKRYSATFILNTKHANTVNYKVIAIPLSPADDNIEQTYEFENGSKIIFNNWVPTGTGVKFMILKKDDQISNL